MKGTSNSIITINLERKQTNYAENFNICFTSDARQQHKRVFRNLEEHKCKVMKRGPLWADEQPPHNATSATPIGITPIPKSSSHPSAQQESHPSTTQHRHWHWHQHRKNNLKKYHLISDVGQKLSTKITNCDNGKGCCYICFAWEARQKNALQLNLFAALI